MRVLKNILGRIWAIWGIIVFASTLLLFFIPLSCCFLWKEPKRSKLSWPLFNIWMDIFLPLIGVFIKVKGKEHFIKGQNYIVVCNHNSLMDVPVSSPRIPGPNKTIAKIEMARIPIFGTAYKLGSILVDRKDKESRRNSYMQMKAVLDMGLHMIIYPEGTRNKTTAPLKEFHDGAFKLATDTQKPIIPAILFGTNAIMPNNKTFYLVPGKIAFHFLAAIPAGDDAELLKTKVHETMKAFIIAHKP